MKDGGLIVGSLSQPACSYRIRNVLGWLACQDKCASWRHRHICDHIRQAALFLETHEPNCPEQAAFSEATRDDRLRVGIRRFLDERGRSAAL